MQAGKPSEKKKLNFRGNYREGIISRNTFFTHKNSDEIRPCQNTITQYR
jgi:hypothetical protein